MTGRRAPRRVRWNLLAVVVLAGCGRPPAPAPGPPAASAVVPVPAFTVAARDIPPALALLVDPAVTDAQLEALVNALRHARETGTLATMIPPTTPAAPNAPYGMVQIYVLSDPAYATDARLRAFVHPATTGDTLSPFEEAFGSRVRAFYFYIAQGGHEVGSIGLDEDGYRYGTTYRKLFGG